MSLARPSYRLAFVLGLAACGGSSATSAVSNTGPVAPAPAATTEIVTLAALENGDRACYVRVVKADGSEASLEGDFELCKGGGHDATALIGKRVTYTTKQAKVLAASCEGDMDCGKSDEVDLVITITHAGS